MSFRTCCRAPLDGPHNPSCRYAGLGGLVVELEREDSVRLTFGELEASIKFVQGGTRRVRLLIQAPRAIKINRSNYQGGGGSDA